MANWRACSASSRSGISFGCSTFRMAKPAGSLTTAESCPAPRPCSASLSSARSVAGFTLPMKPPSTDVASTDFSRASTAKSAPLLSCSRILPASAAEPTMITRTGIAGGGVSWPAPELRKKSPIPRAAAARSPTGARNGMVQCMRPFYAANHFRGADLPDPCSPQFQDRAQALLDGFEMLVIQLPQALLQAFFGYGPALIDYRYGFPAGATDRNEKGRAGLRRTGERNDDHGPAPLVDGIGPRLRDLVGQRVPFPLDSENVRIAIGDFAGANQLLLARSQLSGDRLADIA